MSFSACTSAAVRAVLAKACADLAADETVEQVDIYRRLAQEAKILFDTEKLRERVRTHPLTAEAAAAHPSLVDFVVDESVTHYDAERNCTMDGAVTFTAKVTTASTKGPPAKTKAKHVAPRLQCTYAYERRYAGEPFGTTVSFDVHAIFGHGQKKRLVSAVFRISGRYPVSYYERLAGAGDEPEGDEEQVSGDEEEQEGDNEEQEADEANANDEYEGGNGGDEEDEGGEKEEGDDEMAGLRVLGENEKNWEYIESFEFEQETLEEIHTWLVSAMKGDDGDEPSVQDTMGYILAMPFHEDEFAVDDRIFDVVFDDDDDEDEEGGEGDQDGSANGEGGGDEEEGDDKEEVGDEEGDEDEEEEEDGDE
ncbi:Aste57867_10564 [Aphanomyces stellatus]|uniref:Aste57867_10564 protein n=1 Tax=Aphanomyces stellatus TaxID=120398 RepID=A0A485KQP1_9STRA|nr:hypothetical protein As57867_010524 [Aphanomyces stellatus]VFT87437.1 Aste57867_10564 [Aphanomyces stellatus]